jgi:predicted metal-dependent phosphoesterase TrpH
MAVEWPVLTEDMIREALAKDEADAPRRRQELQERLKRAYGEEWFEQVRQLSPAFAAVAAPAAHSRLDGVAERGWVHASGNADSYLTHTKADPRQPHADKPNRYEQAIAVLKEQRLWPWLLEPRVAEPDAGAADPATDTDEIMDRS